MGEKSAKRSKEWDVQSLWGSAFADVYNPPQLGNAGSGKGEKKK